MSAVPQLVLVVDDDAAVRSSLTRLLQSHGYVVQAYASGAQLLAAGRPEGPACLLLDQHLIAEKGTEVHQRLHQLGWQVPTVFLTADWDTHVVVEAMRGGAGNYLTKPYDPLELLEAVKRAFEEGRHRTEVSEEVAELRQRVAQLTPRERLIVSMAAKGMLNKQIADELGLALVTVKLHRGRAMKKLAAPNVAGLARIALRAGL